MVNESSSTLSASVPTRLKPLFLQGGFSLHGFIARGVASLVLNTLIATGITVFGDHEFTLNLLYAQCIGVSIWLILDVGRLFAISDWEVQWRRVVVLVPVGTLIGYVVGSLLGDWIMHKETLQFWMQEPRKTLGFLLMSLGLGAGGTYFYVNRERLAKSRTTEQMALRCASEARLKLLETQLEPHMLFNTLANLRVLIGVDPARAQQMLDRLNSYLRATLSGSRATTHPLSAEFDRLRDYLELMAVRMGPRLQYTLDLPDALRNEPVPPLLLQPLVENSIKHGLEPKVAGGCIRLRAYQDDGRLALEVSDTGVGLPPAVLAGAALHETGFGLAQVRERLATAYGPQATLEIAANNDGGARATVTFPYINMEPDPSDERACRILRS